MRLFLSLIVLLLGVAINRPACADRPLGEYQVKVAYIYNFAKFVRWPERAFKTIEDPFVIGILGSNPFDRELEPLTMRKVRNRRIEVRHFKNLADLDECHLLYISPSEASRLETTLASLRDRPLLTIGEDKKFAIQGGIIQFVTVRGRLRFIINLEAASASHLQIEAQLLSLASEVLEAGR